MQDLKLKYASSATSLTVTGLDGLANLGYATSDAVDNTSTLYTDILVEATIADIAEAGYKQVMLYLITSIDGTNYSDSQSANIMAMRPLGVVFTNGAGPWRSAAVSVAAACSGVVPPKFKVVLYNDTGVSLAGSGNSVQYRGVSLQAV